MLFFLEFAAVHYGRSVRL